MSRWYSREEETCFLWQPANWHAAAVSYPVPPRFAATKCVEYVGRRGRSPNVSSLGSSVQPEPRFESSP